MALYSVENTNDSNDNRTAMDFKMKIQPDLFSKTEDEVSRPFVDAKSVWV